MMILAYIIAIFATAVSLLVIIITVAGAESCKEYMNKVALMPEGESDLTDAYNDVGISIIVRGFREMEHVQQLMSLNHMRYEIILLTDLHLDDHSEELLECYSMIAIDQTLSDELPCSGVRAVYRSRQRQYHKLMVVDRQRTTISHEYNCGVNLCSYEYVVAIDGWSRFDPDSLQHIVTELFEQREDRRIYAIGGFRVGTLPKNNLRIVDTVMRMVVLGAGMSQLSKMAVEAGFAHTAELGRYAGTVILFDREILIDAGGYKSDFYPDTELYSRIRRGMKRRHANAMALFIPQAVTYEDGADQLSASSLPLSNTSFIERLISRRVSTVFYALCLIALTVGLFAGNAATTEIVSLTLALTYLVTVCAAALSLTVADKLLLNHFHYKSSIQLILSLFLYPFFLLSRLLSPKKFY